MHRRMAGTFVVLMKVTNLVKESYNKAPVCYKNLQFSENLHFSSTTAIQKMRHTWDFSVVLELSTTYMEFGTWMLEENYE